MMRALLATLFFCALALPAHASWLMPQVAPERHYAHRHYAAHWHARRHYARLSSRLHTSGRTSIPLHTILSTACQIARSLGGPCGCFASEQVFGHSVRNLWRAEAWLKFPRTSPHSGAIAAFISRGGHAYHVALAVSDPHGGHITVRDSWATHDVRIAGLVFVDPRGRYAVRARRYRYAGL